MAGIYLGVARVAERYGVSADTVWRWSRNGDMPKPFKLSAGCTRWRMSDLLAHEAKFSVDFVTHLSLPTSFIAE